MAASRSLRRREISHMNRAAKNGMRVAEIVDQESGGSLSLQFERKEFFHV
jgi:hypothetical protein